MKRIEIDIINAVSPEISINFTTKLENLKKFLRNYEKTNKTMFIG